ncbi:MAG: high-affinity iron transporter [Betaproteobacteria bacterium]|jgi:high-affinity iron transporter|nr:high-affinity iron transporter [Betaproteobacteria bacterium]
MGQMLVVTLREGIEMFLIVAIAAAYLRKTGRDSLLSAVWWGTGGAVAASAILGVWLAEIAVRPFSQGILALVAAALVLSMVVYMLKAAKHMRTEIGAKIESAAGRPGAWLGVFLFTLLMITREGMEFAFVAASIATQTGGAALIAGGFMGFLLAGALAIAWARYGQRVNLGLFFQVTSIFMILFVLQLLFYAFHEFTEANALPIDNAYWHLATEEWAEGTYANMISIALILVPLAWLGYASLRAPANGRVSEKA